MTDMKPLLQVRDLSVQYAAQPSSAPAVAGLSFDLAPGEALALVGESGCGKSTTALALAGLLPVGTPSQGQALFEGADLLALAEPAWRLRRGRDIGMIFQEPATALNPVYTIGWQIAEVLHEHTDLSARAVRARVLELLDLVAIAEPHRRIDAFPHELSGGQRQRAMIAAAIALSPRLLIADEPTTALDASIQDQILELLDRLRRQFSMSLLLISHDLPLVSRWTDRMIVMHRGRIMETLASARLDAAAQHPYTRGLVGASLRLEDQRHYSVAPLPEIRFDTRASGADGFTLVTPEPRVFPPPNRQHVVLDARDLQLEYRRDGASFQALSGVSLALHKGETLGLVGESGSGKSSLARALARLVPIRSGRVTLLGSEISRIKGNALRQARRHLQMVFQDPYAALNPRHRIGDILEASLLAHGVGESALRQRQVRQVLDQVGLPAASIERYPHQFSGGQRQRINIARAIILKPSVVICDEPVSALDVSVQAQILNLLLALKAEYGLSYLFISHDLAVVRYFSDTIAVMQAGKIVESGPVAHFSQGGQHPYARQLFSTRREPVSLSEA